MNEDGDAMFIKRMLMFIGVCAAGFFVALAGGVEWGTYEAGFHATVALFVAAILTARAGD